MKFDDYSYNKAKVILKEKELLQEIRKIAEIWSKSKSREERKNRIHEIDWETEHPFSLGNLRPRFDAYKNKVGVEHEKKEQMRARWHMMKMEACHIKGEIDVGVMIYPAGEDPSLTRTKRELEGEIFTRCFPINVPIYVIEYTLPNPQEAIGGGKGD